jgi:hypothetical protein
MYMNPFSFFAGAKDGTMKRADQASSAAAGMTLGPGMQVLHELEHWYAEFIAGSDIQFKTEDGEKLPDIAIEKFIAWDVDSWVKSIPGVLARSGYGGGIGRVEKINNDKDSYLSPGEKVLQTGELPAVAPDLAGAPLATKYRW